MAMRPDGGASRPSVSKPSKPKVNTGGSFSIEGSPSTVRSSGTGKGTTTSRNNSYQAPQVTPAPRSSGGSYSSYGGSYSGGPLTASATGIVAEPAPEPQLTQDQWNLQDSAYQTQMTGIQGELDALLAQLSQAKANYGTDFAGNLRDLGWQTSGGLEGDAWKQGVWNEGDQNTAYGRSYANNQNDYSGRGMLGSSFYAQALEDLIRSFDQQRDAYGQDASRFLADNTASVNNANTAATQSRAQAAQEAAARRAAQYGLV